MRRTRGFAWYHFLFAIPALALAFGVQYFLKKHWSATPQSESTAWTKPSFFRSDTGSGSESGASRALASAKEGNATEMNVEKIDGEDAAENDEGSAEKSGIEPIQASIPKQSEARMPASANGECDGLEYRGDGPAAMKISREDWDRVVLQFTEVKNALSVWLGQHRSEFSEKSAKFMEKQIVLIRIRKPPVADQPDLAWRGIGVYVDETSGPAIHLSPGFVKLARVNPARSKFELSRLVAQSWSPCEIRRADAGEAWTSLLGCLGVQETQACANGSTSESGWAVSSAVAAVVAPPGCKIPAFHSGGLAHCLNKMGVTAISFNQSYGKEEFRQ